MERAEPSLFPQWYKGAGANGSGVIAAPTGGSAPRAEGQGIGLFPRSKVAVGGRILPSSKGTGGVNGSETLSDPYRNFGASRRNYKKREVESRVREPPDVRETRDAVPLVENRFEVSSKVNRLRRPDSTVGGRQVDLGAKKTGGEKRSSVVSRGNVVGSLGKSFFEKDFPSLEEKKRDVDRVSSHGINTSAQSLSKVSSTGIVDDHAQRIPKAMTGLSMAEKLVLEPRVRSPPQIDVDNQRIEELNLSKIKRLVPLTPMTKSLVLKPLEKSKSNGTRGNLNGPPKVGHHSSSQLVNHGLRGQVRPDMPKLSQPGNFQILTRDRNVISPTSKDVPTVNSTPNDVSTANRVVSPTSVVADVHPPLSGPMSPKPKSDGKQTTLSSAQNSFRDKKIPSQAQKRSDFFNDIRKKTSLNISAGCEPSSAVSSLVPGKSSEQSIGNGVISSAGCESSSVAPLSSGKSGEPSTVSNFSGSEYNNYPASHSTINCSTEIAGCEPTSAAPLLGPGKSGDLSTGSSVSVLEDSNYPAPISSISYSTENGKGVAGGLNACDVSEIYVSDNGENESYPEPAIDAEKEAALLKLFGWEEDAREEALTPEEISTFLKKYEKQTPSVKLPQFKFHVLMADLLRKGVGDRAGGSSSACTAEA